MAGTIMLDYVAPELTDQIVSMESGLDGRNNNLRYRIGTRSSKGLNGVRPRWPEQYSGQSYFCLVIRRLNGVRPRWPEQLECRA